MDQPLDVKPGSLRPGPGIDPELPYADTADGPMQTTGNQSAGWAAADLADDELVGDEFIRHHSEEV